MQPQGRRQFPGLLRADPSRSPGFRKQMNVWCSHLCSSSKISDEIWTTTSFNLLVNSGLSLQRSCLESTLIQNQIRNNGMVELRLDEASKVAHST